MKNICIVGLGQLGSRHLQGLAATIQHDCTVTLLEPSNQMRQVAMERYRELPANSFINDIRFLDSVINLPSEIDVLVVATGAEVRADVLRSIFERSRPKNIILEKVIFQKPEDYDEFSEIFRSMDIRVWVNHPRRIFPYYSLLKEELAEFGELNYSVTGGDWGIGCNGLHFIDHLAFIGGVDLTQEKASELRLLTQADRGIHDAKRLGCKEFYGTLVGKLGPHRFQLTSSGSNKAPLVITITSAEGSFLIDETQGKVIKKNNSADKCVDVRDVDIIRYQSQLTGDVVNEVLDRGCCDLPTFEESKNLHIPFINEVLRVLSLDSKVNLVNCPIS